MTLGKIRYYIAASCLILGCSGLPAAIVIWCITEVIPLKGKPLYITFVSAYGIIAFFGLRYYIPRLRGFV